ncbi:hypothetical protein UFOVP573_6 [uncultured Caudovirales phage]|uniref:Uncharacterized protein n=1 Tax=uncultured Caudovirales phage TaxID=2100421 RepID=A0A6J7XLL3_9CAUD|nr:hypothetical protein UFOVP288_109 [uncultured Caudovirales phage]CAB4146125.1 hypothetical protein UFOVP483_87 [uncultured Caudovirales phage]CAB4150524.1 hypothetical protein UFOVP573_6 [uncultured Caudovirales phage]CAB4161595.1 hypothetical protein UFOVP769_109 [uncultured Caudovirales phage]CAB4174711.1 hypothetical protein UFOVP962_77 [uncultured Caudovirales phage]
MRMRWDMGMSASENMVSYGYCISDEEMYQEWREYGNFPLSEVKAGERVLVFCRECKKELPLDEVVDHMLSTGEYPLGHRVHFTIEKE